MNRIAASNVAWGRSTARRGVMATAITLEGNILEDKMPTTMIGNESYEEARKRRHREEAEIDARSAASLRCETLCWACSRAYPAMAESCPHCCCTNANIDPGRAYLEQRSME
jgi:hypothetical protein